MVESQSGQDSQNNLQNPAEHKEKTGFLILDRKVQDTIIVSPGTEREVIIKVLSLHRRKITIGIRAPASELVMRGELLEGDDKEKS